MSFLPRQIRGRRWRTVLTAVLVVLAAAVPAAAGRDDGAAQLDGRMSYVAASIAGKHARSRLVRDHLQPVFRDEDGRDRFLLNFVAMVQRRGFVDGVVRRLTWTVADLDPAYGYAEVDVRACGRWYLWLPRCFTTQFQWRLLQDRWLLLPPATIQLDPDL